MAAANFDFTDTYAFTQGDTWAFSLRYRVGTNDYRDLTGLHPKMQIRKKVGGDVLLTFEEAAAPLTGITIADQGDPDGIGLMNFLANSDDTADLKTGDWYFDVQLSDESDPPVIETFIYGTFTIGTQVTL